MAKKISYLTRTIERPITAPRESAWQALESAGLGDRDDVVLDGYDGTHLEVPLSTEPPWRLVVRLDGPHPSTLCQTSITIRDDGDSCLVAWSCLIDPTDLTPEHAEALLTDVATDGERQLDRLEGAVTY